MSILGFHNSSGFSFNATLIASKTFPNTGINITSWADDADPFDVPVINVAQTAKNINGTLITWSFAEPIPISFSVIAGTQDDQSLQFLLAANTPFPGGVLANDVITITANYPTGDRKIFSDGVIISGVPAIAISSGQRTKTNSYTFHFSKWTTS
jgi:hypothetical protein